MIRPCVALLGLLPLVTACAGETLDAGTTASTPAPLTSTPTTLATLGVMIDTMAMDTQFLYFTTEDGHLYRLAKSGGTPEPIASAGVPGTTFSPAYTEGLVTDGESLYWTAWGDGMTGGAVLRVASSGGTPAVLAGGQARPEGIAVDDANVYWANQGSPPPTENGLTGTGAPGVLSVPKGGGSVTVLVEMPVAPDHVVLDATGVIWHESQAIRRVPKAGGVVMTLSESAVPWGSSNLVVAGDTLYWADDGVWSLESVPLAGGSVTTLAGGIDEPGGLLVDGASVVWDVAHGASVGAIDAIAAGGGDVVVEATSDAVTGEAAQGAKLLLADDAAYYWVEYWDARGASAPGVTVVVRTLSR